LGRSTYVHDPTAAGGTTYYYRVAAVDSSGTRGPLSAPVAIVTRLSEKPGWPVSAGNEFWASPVIIDLKEDGTGDRELVDGCLDFAAYVWNADGTNLANWPLY